MSVIRYIAWFCKKILVSEPRVNVRFIKNGLSDVISREEIRQVNSYLLQSHLDQSLVHCNNSFLKGCLDCRSYLN